MIQIARIYEPAQKSAGWRVLVDRLWPRGIKKENAPGDLWMKDIAPEPGTARVVRHKPERWTEFQRRYRAELSKKKELVAELKRAEKMHGKLTLLFGARDKEHNQAVVLLHMLKNKK